MAIPSNYIDKINKDGDSRPICPAADKVRVENQNFESGDLDGALNELAGGKANKDETYTKEEVNEKVPLRIAAIKNGDVITSTTDYGEIANAVKEDWRDAYVVVNNEAIFSFYQVEQNAIIFTRVDAEDGTQAYLAVSSNNVWSIEYSAISGGGEGTVTGVKVGETTYPPNTEGVVDISAPISNKVDKVTGKGLSTNDYTDAEKTKLAGIAAGAQVNVISGIKAHGASTNLPVTNGVVELPESEAGTQGPKGDKGDTVVLDPQGLPQFTIVNDLTTGGEADALSAEMGKRLALMSGTFAQAWARSKAIPFPFCFLWNETIDGDAISKPIWHKGNSVFVDAAGAIVNVSALDVPDPPTITGATSGDSVPKNTQITITPASGSALYYSLDGGTTYNVSDAAVTIALTTAGSVSIVAYCANNAGNSSNATLSVTIEGTAVPTFAEKPNSGTTLTQKTGYIEVSRGGYVRISGTEDGTLYYSTDGENYTEVQGNNYYDFQIANSSYEATAFVIYAKNKVGNDFSDPVTGTFKMAALQAPTLTPAGGEVASGSTVAITATVGSIYYTTDGSDPDDQSTAYSSAIAITGGVTIKAIAKDSYGYSAITSGTYSIAVPKLKVTASDATTMTLTKTDDTTVSLNISSGANEFLFDTDLGGVTEFKSCVFGDKTKIVSIDFGGISLRTASSLFKSCTGLTSCKNLKIKGGQQILSDAFNGCTNLEEISLLGTVSYLDSTFISVGSGVEGGCSIDMTGLSGTIAGWNNAFKGLVPTGGILDIRNLILSSGASYVSVFENCKATKLVVGNLVFPSVGDSTFRGCLITTLECTTTTPPSLSVDWIAKLKNVAGNSLSIIVPNGCGSAYKSASIWSNYEDIIIEKSE